MSNICISSIDQWDFYHSNGDIYDISDKSKLYKNLDNIDLSKPGILIIDDNDGVCSFLKDDLLALDTENKINYKKYNIFIFSGKKCAYKLLSTIQKYPNINIKKAIIDITYSSFIKTKKGNISLNGIDIFETLFELNINMKYIFYSGNQLDSQINKMSHIVSKYKSITGKIISDNLIYKTQYNILDRQKELYSRLFS